MEFLDKVKNSPNLGYKQKHVNNKPTEDCFLLIKHITNIIKIKNHVWIRTKEVKLGAIKKRINETIGHVNK